MNASLDTDLNQCPPNIKSLLELSDRPVAAMSELERRLYRNGAFESLATSFSTLQGNLTLDLQQNIAMFQRADGGYWSGRNDIEIKLDCRGPSGVKPISFMSVRLIIDGEAWWIGSCKTCFEDPLGARLSQNQLSQIHSSRLAALGEMASGIAHEINNPLTVILAKAHTIESRLAAIDSPEARQLIDAAQKIKTHAVRITKIVRGLKSFSRDDSGDPMLPCNLSKVVDECIAICAERMKAAGILLYVNIQDADLRVLGRDVQLSQILMNLLNNAYDAVSSTSLPEIHVDVRSVGNGIVVRVWDNGPGVSAEIAEKIMLPFFTTKETGSGTGLGLSISLGIAKAHGGSLALNRSVHPSCFELTLPVLQSSPAYGKGA